MTNFGATLKKAREAKGISLDQIAKKTRISTRLLTAIENEEFHLLPGGIFNRGFIRAFAETVGVDPDQAVADYERLASMREPADVVASASARPTRNERHLYPIAIGILAIAIAIFYVMSREVRGPSGAASPPPVPAAEPRQPAPQSTPQPESTQPVTSPQTPAAEPEAKPSQTLTIDIEAREKTWIKVTSDGASVNPGEVLEPGMTRKFSADMSILLSVGNAAGLALKINDMPAKPLGRSGEVKSVTITPSNLKDFIG